MEAIYHEAGRAVLENNVWNYEYVLTDHLGNTRVVFKNVGSVAAVVQENEYYPFGMEFEEEENKYAYKKNGIERNDEFGLNIDQAFFRNYDASYCRWWQVDTKPNANLSVYSGFGNNPVRFSDVLGDTIKYANADIQAFVEKYTQKTYISKKGKEKREPRLQRDFCWFD